MTINAAPPDLTRLHSIERRLESALRDLRQFRTDYQRAQQDRGVLGSRGLTEFCLDLLRPRQQTIAGILVYVSSPYSIREMMALAEQAGYALPTARTLSKRLTERGYRVGDVYFDELAQRWYGKRKEEKEEKL